VAAKLIFAPLMSLDGYIADENGRFHWALPAPEVHAFLNELLRPVGTYLYGRRLYEAMRVWEEIDPDQSGVMGEFARLWQAADKIVYSRTLPAATTARTRLERGFDPEAVARMKATAERDLLLGGGNLAGQVFRAGLVDECRLFISPVLIGGGFRFLPDGVRAALELVDQRRFGNGVVYLHYRVRR